MIDHHAFFDSVRGSLFRGTLTGSQVSGMEAILNEAPDDFRTDYLAYCLATTYHETGKTMQPIEEYGKGRGHAYGLPTGPWHQVYDGKGDVQLTWQANYKKATTRLRELGMLADGEDLEKTPALAMRPDLAAAILFVGMSEGWFTGKKLSDYFSNTKSDPVNARRIINGTDKASTIAGYYRLFLVALHDATVATSSTAQAVVVKTVMPVAPLSADGTHPALAPVHIDPQPKPETPEPEPKVTYIPAPAPTVAVPPKAPAALSFWQRLFGHK